MVAEVRRRRAEFYTTRRVAKMFGVSLPTVVKWIESGLIRCDRGEKRLARRYIHVEEVERFKQVFLGWEKAAMEVRSSGAASVAEAARVLGVRVPTVASWCRSGFLRAYTVREPRGREWRHVLIPLSEVERVKRKLESDREEGERVLSEGIRLEEVAASLRVSPHTLRKWRRQGKLRAMTVHCRRRGSGRLSVIPWEEIERLEHELNSSSDQWERHYRS